MKESTSACRKQPSRPDMVTRTFRIPEPIYKALIAYAYENHLNIATGLRMLLAESLKDRLRKDT